MPTDYCHLCQGALFATPVLHLCGMPKAAQYYPQESEFLADTGIDLDIRQCSRCGLLQLACEPVDYYREVITFATLSEKARSSRLSQMRAFAARFGLLGKSILDIGTGKGEMLDVLSEAGMRPTGIEAGTESAAIGIGAGRKVIHGYIGAPGTLDGAPFDSFICLNFLEHLPQPGEIIANIHRLTTADSVGFVTVPNAEYLLRTRSFYEFVADHLSYFTTRTLTFAFEANGFDVLDCQLINEENDIALTVKKKAPLQLADQYHEVDSLIEELRNLVGRYTAQGKKVAVWGAGHRTLALLALARLDGLSYIVDSAKFKQDKYAPVTHLPIRSPETLRTCRVDLILVMVPGLYPDEVARILKDMALGVDIALLRNNCLDFMD